MGNQTLMFQANIRAEVTKVSEFYVLQIGAYKERMKNLKKMTGLGGNFVPSNINAVLDEIDHHARKLTILDECPLRKSKLGPMLVELSECAAVIRRKLGMD